MLFYSSFFLFFFFPILFLSYVKVPKRFKNYLLLLASLFFYFYGEPRFFLIAVVSAIIDYFLSWKIFETKNKLIAQKYLILGIVLNVGLLFFYKYLDFFIGNFNDMLGYLNQSSLPLLQIALPIGISFIVFEKITYLVDIYRGISEPATSLKNYLLYVFLFPKLLAGPIIKYHDIAAQITHHKSQTEDYFIGFKRFLLGLIKKILVADTIGTVSDQVFQLSASQLSFSLAWLGVICFTLQIYLDFSAYSDMAIGLARMFGFKLQENFNMPYTAVNFTDFWRRWHISLSTWIREYLYIPLGGNRKGQLRAQFNLWICFLISGFWHGAKWNFIIWGLYHGVFLILDKLFWLRVSKHFPKHLNVFLTLFFVMLGWVCFRVSSLSQLGYFFEALFNPMNNENFIYITSNVWLAIFLGALISLIPSWERYQTWLALWRSLNSALVIENWSLVCLAFFSFIRIISSAFNPFLYFRF